MRPWAKVGILLGISFIGGIGCCLSSGSPYRNHFSILDDPKYANLKRILGKKFVATRHQFVCKYPDSPRVALLEVWPEKRKDEDLEGVHRLPTVSEYRSKIFPRHVNTKEIVMLLNPGDQFEIVDLQWEESPITVGVDLIARYSNGVRFSPLLVPRGYRDVQGIIDALKREGFEEAPAGQ